MCGDGYITPAQLRNVLDKVPGNIVLVLGSCYSGSVIAKSAQTDDAQVMLNQFIGPTSKSGEFKAGKYQVLCASRQTEESLGVLTTIPGSSSLVEEGTYNFFGKAFIEGGQGSADADANGKITLHELYSYTHTRVKQLYAYWQTELGLSPSGTQTVVCYPANSSFVVF